MNECVNKCEKKNHSNTHTHRERWMDDKLKEKKIILKEITVIFRLNRTLSGPSCPKHRRCCYPGVTGHRSHQERNTSSLDKGEHSHQLCIDLQ